MNKWRLLLLSIFALHHITTSKGNFIDGRYRCCDHTQRFTTDSRLALHDSYQDRRFFPEPRQLNKYTTEEQETEHRERRFLTNGLRDENRRAITRRTRILNSIPEITRGRQQSRERVERSHDRAELRHDRFARQFDRQYQSDARVTILVRGERYEVTRNRFEIEHVRHLDNNRDANSNIPENGNEIKFTNRNTDVNDLRDSAIRVVREDSSSHKVQRLRTNALDARRSIIERNARLALRREDYARKRELSRMAPRMIVGSEERRESSEERRDRIKQFNRNSMQRDVDDTRERSDFKINRARDTRQDMRDTKISEEFRQSSRQLRDYTENRFEKDTRNNQLRKLNRNLELMRRDNRLGQRISEDLLRNVREGRAQFERRNYNIRASFLNFQSKFITQRRTLSEEASRNRDLRTERRENELRNSREYTERWERVNELASRLNRNRYSEDPNIQVINEKSIDMQRDIFERNARNILDRNGRDNRRTDTRRNLSQESRLRIDLRRSNRNVRVINDDIIRMKRRINVPSLTSNFEIRNFRDFRDNGEERRFTERFDRENVRQETSNRIRNDNSRERFENEHRLRSRSVENRISLTVHKDIAELRGIENARFVDKLRQISRRTTEERSVSRIFDIRESRDARHTKNTEEKRINNRGVASLMNQREIRKESTETQRYMRMRMVKSQNDSFEVKWQYLFYLVQVVYICSFLIKLPTHNEGTKKKMRVDNWFSTAGLLKMD